MQLTRIGYSKTGHPINQDQVEDAKAYLTQMAGRPEAELAGFHSYGLKHWAEDEIGRYISNGAMIRAALELGYRVDPYGGENPNAKIWAKVVKPKYPRRVRPLTNY